jgi:GT2 family glycosyltransferase
MITNSNPIISVLIISFNTCDLLRRCLNNVLENSKELLIEIIVVDNGSKDISADMVSLEFPAIHLIRSEINLGFGAANNVGYQASKGEYIVLLNSDAFLEPQSLKLALDKIKLDASIGLGGGQLIGLNGEKQPSAKMFPSLLNEFLQLSGLAGKYPKSKLFGRYNYTWKEPYLPFSVDWVPGAFAIIPRQVLQEVGFFDERFFLYYEEVDLCFRIKKAGYSIWYWPTILITHICGESSKTQQHLFYDDKSAQLKLWSMRSALLYFRKNYGWWSSFLLSYFERSWHHLRALKNYKNPEKVKESRLHIKLLKQAWKETRGGSMSPPKPWK